MNPEAQARLDEILANEPAALTEGDTEFLKARRDYLTDEQKAAYGLSDASSSGEVEQSRARKGRKASAESEQPEA